MQSSKLRFLSDIAQQSYSPNEIRKCIRVEDFWRYELIESELDDLTTEFSRVFYDTNHSTSPLLISKIGGKFIFRISDYKDALCIRRTDQILRNTLRIHPPNRDDEVRQLVEVIKTESQRNIFKGDIKQFFESINFNEVIDKIESDGLRNSSTLSHLRSINQKLISQAGYAGLPRGLSISATLADYILQDFDRSIINEKSVTYYCRYVDDICIVHSLDGKNLEKTISSELPLDLKLNPEKTNHVPASTGGVFDFLGYQISTGYHPNISVAKSKISRVKKRLILALRSYLKKNNFGLLYRRVIFLSSTIEMEISGRVECVFSGIPHVYRHCTPRLLSRQMCELDKFYQAQLTSHRFWLSRELNIRLSIQQKNALRKISFYNSLKDKKTFKFGRDLISKIKHAWHYE